MQPQLENGQQQQQQSQFRSTEDDPTLRRKDALRFFAASTTAHGFHKLTQSTRSLQISWLLLITSAFCGLTVHLTSLVIKFCDEPITTKVDPKGSIFVYPDVTVCNKMMFGISNIISQDLAGGSSGGTGSDEPTYVYRLKPEFQRLYEDVQNVRDILNRTVRQYLLENFGAYEQNLDLLRVQDDSVYNLPNLVIRDTYGLPRISKFAAQARQMLLRCSFGTLACDHRDFRRLTLPAYASCFTFSLSQFLQNRPDTDVSTLSELQLVLFVDAIQHEPAVIDALKGLPGDTFNMQTNGGVVVFFHQPGTYPTNGQSVEASCGQETVIDVRYQEFSAKNRRKEPCQEEATGSPMIQQYLVAKGDRMALADFAQQPLDCRIRIAQLVLLESCGFVDPNLPISSEFHGQPRRGNLSRLLDSVNSSDPDEIIDQVVAMFSAGRGNGSASGNASVQLPAVLERLLDNETCLRRARILAGNDTRLDQCMDGCRSRAYTASFMSNAWPVANADFLRPLVTRWLQSNAYYLNGSSRQEDVVNMEFVRLTNWNLFSAFSAIGSGSALRNLLALRVRAGDPQGRGLSTEESWGYEIHDLLSDIGGILGLYLGMSLLTLCEMAELLLQLVAYTRLRQGLGGGQIKSPASVTAAVSEPGGTGDGYLNRGLDLELDLDASRPGTEYQPPAQRRPTSGR